MYIYIYIWAHAHSAPRRLLSSLLPTLSLPYLCAPSRTVSIALVQAQALGEGTQRTSADCDSARAHIRWHGNGREGHCFGGQGQAGREDLKAHSNDLKAHSNDLEAHSKAHAEYLGRLARSCRLLGAPAASWCRPEGGGALGRERGEGKDTGGGDGAKVQGRGGAAGLGGLLHHSIAPLLEERFRRQMGCDCRVVCRHGAGQFRFLPLRQFCRSALPFCLHVRGREWACACGRL